MEFDNNPQIDDSGQECTRAKYELVQMNIEELQKRGKELDERLKWTTAEGRESDIIRLEKNISEIKKQISYYENDFKHPEPKPERVKTQISMQPYFPILNKVSKRIIPIHRNSLDKIKDPVDSDM